MKRHSEKGRKMERNRYRGRLWDDREREKKILNEKIVDEDNYVFISLRKWDENIHETERDRERNGEKNTKKRVKIDQNIECDMEIKNVCIWEREKLRIKMDQNVESDRKWDRNRKKCVEEKRQRKGRDRK